MINNISSASAFFKVLSDPTRLRIINVLITKGKMCVSEIADEVKMSHSSVSHQLSKLELHNLVKCEREGQTICYEIIDEETKSKLKKQIRIAVI